MGSSNRIVWADALKGWLMILVVVGHVIQVWLREECNDSHLWNIIYSFHMPAFMALSGYLTYCKSIILPPPLQSGRLGRIV
jgi:fucose 4-O-acetylase-like acetyltransferase